jgi:PAS domain S-box-containing protein
MKSLAVDFTDDAGDAVSTLVQQLHGLENRLQELTGGEVDSVIHPSGQSYLLRQAQEKLRQNETLLKMAGHAAQLGGWEVELQPKRVTWSDEVCAIHEMPPGTVPDLEDAINFYDPESRETIRTVFNGCARDGTPFDVEAKLITATGKSIWVHAMGEAVRDDKGIIVRVQGAFQDISERKQAEIKLRQSEIAQREFAATQSSILNALPAHIALLDRAGVIVSVNESWRQFAGDNALQDTASAIGQNYLEVCERANNHHAMEANAVAGGIRSVMSGTARRFTLEYPCHSPTEQRWFLLMVSPMRSDEWQVTGDQPGPPPVTGHSSSVTSFGGAVVMHINVTERKLAELRLQRLNRLHTVLGKVSEAVMRTRERQELYDTVCRIVMEDGKLRMVFVAELDAESGLARPVASYGEGREYLSAPVSVIPTDGGPLSQGTVGTALRTGAPDFCNDIAGATRMKPWHETAKKFGLRANASFPFHLRGTTVGAIVLYAGETDYFQDDEMRLMVSVASDISIALDALEKERQRQQSENALRASESSMATAQRIGHFGSWELDLANTTGVDANALRWSAEMFRIAGFEPGTVEVSNGLFFSLVPAEEHEMIRQAVAAAIRERREYSIVHRLIRPDGEVRVIQETAQIFYDKKTALPSKFVGTAHDITERRLAEKALRESEERLRLITNLVPHGIFAKDAAGRHIFANTALAEFAGLSVGEILGKTDFDLVPDKAQAEAYRADDFAVIQSGSKKFIPAEPRTDFSGRTRFLQTTKIPFTVPGTGEPAVLGVCVDITERKLAEESLQLRQIELQALFDLMPAMLCFKDTNNVFLRVNQRLADAAGATIAEIEGKPAADFFPRDAAKYYADDLEVIRSRTAKLGIVEKLQSLDGKDLWVETDKVPVSDKDGNVTGIVVMVQDITRRRLNEEALRFSESNMATAQSIAHFGSWELELKNLEDVAANPVRWSDEIFRIAGFPPGAFKPSNDLFFCCVPLEEHAMIYQAMAKAIHERGHYSIVHRIIRPDGEERVVHEVAQIFSDEQTGRPIKIVGTTHDITERKRAEESLVLFRTLIDQSSDSIEVVDPITYRYLDVNESACTSHGYTRKEMLSMSVGDIDPDLTPALQERIERELKTAGRMVIDSRHRRKDGTIFPVEVTVKLVQLDKGYMVAMVRDVTERRQAERLLRESEERFRSMFAFAATGIAMSTPQGRFVQANAAYCRMLGYTQEELLEKNFASVTHPDDLALNLKMRDELLAGERDSFVMEKRYLKKNGDITWTSHSVSPVRAANAEISLFIVVAEDITERKYVEAALDASQTRHRLLFENMLEGYCYCWMLYEQGRACDYIYLKVNDAFGRQTGLKNVEGRKVSEVVPGMHEANPEQLEIYSRVAATGKPEHFETYAIRLGIWFSVSVYSYEKDHFIAVFDNITERKKSEESLRLFRTLIDHSNDVIEVLDTETRHYLDVNERACVSLGYSREELLGLSVFDIDPDISPSLQDKIRHELQTSGFITFESSHRRKDGTAFPVEVNIKRVQLDKGYDVSVVRDITERKRTEEQLLWKTAFLEAQVHSALDGIMVIDSDRRLILQNQRLIDLWNTPAAFVIGNAGPQRLDVITRQVKHPAQFSEKVEWLYDHPDEISRDEVELVDGKTLDRYSAPVKGRDGKFYGRIWTFRDITERKRMETRFRRLVDSNAQSVFFWNLKGEITGSNDAFLKLVGYTRADLDAGHMSWSVMTPPEYAEADQRALKEITDKGTCGTYEKEFIRKDGTRVPILIGAATFEDKPDEGVCFILDLTENKKLEQQFRQSQKMESIGTLAGGVAHDFNNILAVIQIQTDLFKLNHELPPDQLEYIETIGAATRRATALTRQLLLFSRKQAIHLRDLDLDKSINDITNMLRRILGADIQLQFKFSLQPLFIRADAGMMDQVLMNLVVNARDAMPKGGRLIIETAAVDFDENIREQSAQARPGTFVCLSVSDNGCGIPPENLARIFEPFFTTKAVGKGTGLGLATVFGIVEQHHGWVDVYSEVGQGTTFRIYFPRLATASPQKSEPSQLTPCAAALKPSCMSKTMRFCVPPSATPWHGWATACSPPATAPKRWKSGKNTATKSACCSRTW